MVVCGNAQLILRSIAKLNDINQKDVKPMQKAKPTNEVILIQMPYSKQIIAVENNQKGELKDFLAKTEYEFVGTVNTAYTAKELNKAIYAPFDLLHGALKELASVTEMLKLAKEVPII